MFEYTSKALVEMACRHDNPDLSLVNFVGNHGKLSSVSKSLTKLRVNPNGLTPGL